MRTMRAVRIHEKGDPGNLRLDEVPLPEPAAGEATLCALAVETDDTTGLAKRLAPVRLGGRLEEARPAFWG